MAESLIGELPRGWSEASLADVAELAAGTSTTTSEDGSTGVAKPKNLIRGRIAGPPDRIEDNEAQRLSRYRLVAGDIVCVRTGGLGRHALVTSEQHGWVCGTGLIRVRPRATVDRHYLSGYLSHPTVLDWLKRNSVRSPIPSISTTVLGTLPVALPPPDTQRSIGHALHTLDEKIAAHQSIARTTSELRDVLLPLLLDGSVIPPGHG
ncbi:restriction endonuclease subunit S [Nonomuraea fuscirosea]|uniref:restriction endonuclease subunit S n=1 Tax=Nonomuraea fuscirosea TaxID=1291556 RepID=UPI00343C5185